MEWIKITQSQPNKDCKVIAYGYDGCHGYELPPFVCEAKWFNDEKIFRFGEYECDFIASHWMPLPEPPED